MKITTIKYLLLYAFGFLLTISKTFAQDIDISLQSGLYNQDPYPSYSVNGSVTGTYTIRVAKSTHTFSAGQFTINVAFPAGAVYAGGGTIPSEFTVTSGADGSSSVVISITGNWSGSGPTALRTIVLPIKIVAAANDQPTGTSLQWLDPFVTENSNLNSTGSPLNVASNPLPVILTTFTASKEAQTSLLSWSTTEESNSDHFDIQHSVNAKNWSSIGIVSAQGESKVLKKYTFAHEEPAGGENLYRLKMVDEDGTFAYSRIVSLIFDEGAIANIYPNPARTFVNVTASQPISEVQLINLSGVTMMSKNFNGTNKKEPWTFGAIIPGAYQVKIITKNGSVQYKKVIVTE